MDLYLPFRARIVLTPGIVVDGKNRPKSDIQSQRESEQEDGTPAVSPTGN